MNMFLQYIGKNIFAYQVYYSLMNMIQKKKKKKKKIIIGMMMTEKALILKLKFQMKLKRQLF